MVLKRPDHGETMLHVRARGKQWPLLHANTMESGRTAYLATPDHLDLTARVMNHLLGPPPVAVVPADKQVVLTRQEKQTLVVPPGWFGDLQQDLYRPGIQVFESLRGLDYLLTRSDVDPHRIGIAGLCQESEQTWLATALEDRFQVVVPVCGTTTYEQWVRMPADQAVDLSDPSPRVANVLYDADWHGIGACIAMAWSSLPPVSHSTAMWSAFPIILTESQGPPLRQQCGVLLWLL